MSTELHTLIGIFKSSFEYAGDQIDIKRISIPIIQRDYAQGRPGPEIARVRDRFLKSLRTAVTGNPITLDFVYGDVDADGVLTPLDGQQRLTTLFLLHWYAAKKEKLEKDQYEFLEGFGYEVRPSARDFCKRMLDFDPTFEGEVSKEIKDQYWFPYDWLKDPTVSSMLVMLDSIQEQFADVDSLWQKLEDGAISFYFLPIKDMGLTDDLYIKMNSRGKPLTRFEHFKAELEGSLKRIDQESARRIGGKIDGSWTDLLWRYQDDGGTVDDFFLRYFRFVCDVICYHGGETPQGKSSDEFDLLKEYFDIDTPNVTANISLLESMFDCWTGIDPSEFLNSVMSHEHESGKVQIENRYAVDIFESCLRGYADVRGNGNRFFPLNRFIVLYAIVTYLQARETVSAEQFARRLRIVNNLAQNSEDEISDSETRTSGNRMPAILRQVRKIMLEGIIDASIEKALNKVQIEEEIAKEQWLSSHPDLSESLYELEDHSLLRGQISAVGLEKPEHFSRFASLFECDRDLVDCALMACGFYPQLERCGWRFQFGSWENEEAWRSLFHKSSNKRFGETAKALGLLLDEAENFDDDKLSQIKAAYLSSCEEGGTFDYRYYYLKYNCFRPGSHGKCSNFNFDSRPYAFSVMKTKSRWSENTYIPFLVAIEKVVGRKVSRQHNGQRILVAENAYLKSENDAYTLCIGEDEVAKRWVIPQNGGVDAIDRIAFMRTELSSKGIEAYLQAKSCSALSNNQE